MIISDVEYLKCVKCGGEVSLEAFEKKNGECVSGKLVCKSRSCGKEYPVIGGIPRMFLDHWMKELVVKKHPGFFERHGTRIRIDSRGVAGKDWEHDNLKKRTAESFGFEWLKYPKILSQFEKDWKRYFNPFITRQEVKGKVVADFGCGMAKHGYFTAKYGAKKYIGLDLSDAVEAAYANTRKFRPLIVQADIYNPPLRGEKVDIFYSIGVIHHLPDPKKGFLTIAKLMKRGSKVFIWVYAKHRNLRASLVYDPVRVVTTRIPKGLLHKLCHIPAAGLHLINLGQKGLSLAGFEKAVNRMPFSYYMSVPYMFKVSDSFDVFGTPKQVYYGLEDIKAWLKQAKLRQELYEFDSIQGLKAFGMK